MQPAAITTVGLPKKTQHPTPRKSTAGVTDRAFGADSEGERAAAIELAVEALYLTQKISKDSGEGETIYG